MGRSEVTQCNNCAILLEHGTNDTLNPIFKVRREVDNSTCTLEEINGGGHF